MRGLVCCEQMHWLEYVKVGCVYLACLRCLPSVLATNSWKGLALCCICLEVNSSVRRDNGTGADVNNSRGGEFLCLWEGRAFLCRLLSGYVHYLMLKTSAGGEVGQSVCTLCGRAFCGSNKCEGIC